MACPPARHVSIRARHCWRAMRCAIKPGWTSTTCFNPRPPLLAGDAILETFFLSNPVVSIRARHCWRAMPADGERRFGLTLFQSAPAIAGGRCHVSPMNFQVSRAFQSAPAIAGGRCARALDERGVAGVSIRARHCWRAMPPAPDASGFITLFQSAPAIAGGRCTLQGRQPELLTGFNPRPPLLAGDALQGFGVAARINVSIRARHCWRAMPSTSAPPASRMRFQSAPAIAGGRCCRRDGARIRSGRFNPRPPLLAGDARVPASITAVCLCFNPRPPLLAGDANGRESWSEAFKVSIRARHCWRAMLRACSRAAAARAVSIRARHCWRAMRASGTAGLTAAHVSIRARHCWRAMPSLLTSKFLTRAFQSAPAIAGGRCDRRHARRRCPPRFNPRPPLLAGDASPPPVVA